MPKKILVTTPSFGKYSSKPIELVQNAGYQLFNDYGLKKLYTLSAEEQEDIVAIIVGLEPITTQTFQVLPNLKAVLKHGAGIDNIDQEAAAKAGVKIFNAPGANAIAVAEYTIGLMLALSRSIAKTDNDIRSGKWIKYYGFELAGKTLSIIGFGAIGSIVARIATGFGMRVLAYDALKKDITGAEQVSFETAIREADYISLHTPLLPETKDMINAESISRMKNGAFIINTARGGLIDEEALCQALRTGKLGGAALDAFATEPNIAPALLEMDNLVLSAHNGGFTQEALNRISDITAKNLVEYLGSV